MFNILFISPTSVTLELDNKDIYYASNPYDVYLNDELVISQEKRNVTSIFDLTPDTTYVIRIGEDKKEIHTLPISVIFDINDFGVYKDDIHDDTKAINQAIMMLPKNGLLVLDKGIYRITSLFLKSDIHIELKEGAILKAFEDVSLYPTYKGEIKGIKDDECVQLGQWEGSPFPMKASIISGYWLNNVNLYGKGIVDGNAQNSTWWINHRALKFGRPRLVFLDGCENVNIQGLIFKNTPCWTLHPFYSKKIGFYDLYIKNPKDSPNTDGMNPESCDDVKIIGIHFSVGDDCIAIKSGKMYMGMKYKTPCSNLIIRNCYMQDGHGGVVLGSEMSGGIKNLTVERCIFEKTDRGLRIKTRRGRGKYAVIDGVTFNDIYMDGVLNPLVINMFYFCDPDGQTEYVYSKEKLPVDERTPYLGKFTFKRIKAINAEWSAGYFYGLPERPIEEIRIEDSSISFKDEATCGQPAMMSFAEDVSKLGFFFNGVNKVILKNVSLSGQEGSRIIKENVGSIEDDE